MEDELLVSETSAEPATFALIKDRLRLPGFLDRAWGFA